MAQENKINLIVVVSGEDVNVTVNPHQKVAELAREALRTSGNQGQPLENWVLKDSVGTGMDFDARIGEAGITDGAKLFLSPKVGEGGA